MEVLVVLASAQAVAHNKVVEALPGTFSAALSAILELAAAFGADGLVEPAIFEVPA